MSLPPNILAVLLVPLRAAPCFHILSAPACQSAVVGETAQPAQSVCLRSNGFSAHTTLAIILVCVFNRSEQLPSWLSACLKKGDGLSVGIWLGQVFSLAEVFYACTIIFL